MKIGIIDYQVGNIASIQNALNRLGVKSFVSKIPKELEVADGFILPGDGAAKKGMENLTSFGLDVLIKKVIANKKPFLGICLGMQLLLSFSEEGNVTCLHILEGEVKKLQTKLKVPQIGWNQVSIKNKELRIMNKIPEESYFYFINSYVCLPKDQSVVAGITDYGEMFCSALEKDIIFGVQFHPEKSGEVGLQVLRNFMKAI